MDKSEFTEPFDLERFMQGEVALSAVGNLFKFQSLSADQICAANISLGTKCKMEAKKFAARCKMRPVAGGANIPTSSVCIRCGATEETMRKHGCAGVAQGLPICAPWKLFEVLDSETSKQRLNREAYERYKAAHPESRPVLPIGEDRMNEIAATALVEHDRIWPKKT